MQNNIRVPLRIIAIYVAVAVFWLIVGDWLLFSVVADHVRLAGIDLLKDFLFIVISGGLLLWLVTRAGRRYEDLFSRYQGVFDAANDAFLVFDENGVIIDANQKACRLYGYPHEQLIGRSGRDIVHPDHYYLFERFVGATQLDLEATIDSIDIRADGSSFPVEVRGAIIPYHGKACKLAIVRDVSHRVAMEKIRNDSEARWDLAMDFVDDAIILLDINGLILRANRACYRFVKLPRVQVIGRQIGALFHPAGENASCHICEVLSARQDSIVTLAAADPENPFGLPVEVMVRVMRDGSGEATGMLMGIRDLSRFEELRKHAHILAQLHEAIVVTDLHGTITSWNKGAEDLLGYAAPEAIGRQLSALFGEAVLPAPDNGLAEADKTGMRADYSLAGKSGITRHCQVSASYFLGHGGKPVGVSYAMVDITEHLEAEQQLVEQLRLLSLGSDLGLELTQGGGLHDMLQRCVTLLVRHLDVAFARIWTVDEQENVLRLKASAGIYTHLDGAHATIPIDATTKIGNIALTKIPHLTNTVVGDPQVTDQEWAVREGMVAFAGHPLLISDRLVGVMALFARQPLSEMVLHSLGAIAREMALGIERAFFELELVRKNRALRILSECNEILVRARDERQFLADICEVIVSGGGYRMAWVGLKEHDPDRSVRVAASAGDGNNYLDAIRVSWDDNKWGRGPTGRAIRLGITAYCNDIGSDQNFIPWREAALQSLFSSSVAIPLSQDDEVFGALNIYAVTDKKPVAEEVRLLEELANDVAYGIRVLRERVAGKAVEKERRQLERQVRQGQKMEAIGTLAGGIAHDFNNILAAILGFTDLAKYKLTPGSELHRDLDNVLQAAGRAKELVKQILTFSRQAEQERRPVALHLIVKEALKLLRASIPKHIDFQVDIAEDSGMVVADPIQLHQVVMNLCTNGYQAMRECETGVLQVSLRAVAIDGEDHGGSHLEAGKYVELVVADTGFGIAPEIQERVFEPYFTTKARGEGTGMGLAVVHGIVLGCGGEIHVESEPGHGATFRVYFPQSQSEASAMESIVAQQLPGGSERVLVVDDEPVVADLYRSMLERLGYRVTLFGDSAMALEEFARRPGKFDLLLTDMAMPGMPGDVLVQKIKAIRADIPVIMCTGFSEKMTTEKARAMGIDKLLMKPLLIRELAASIREILDS